MATIIAGLVAFNVFSRITSPDPAVPAASPAWTTDMADIEVIDAEKRFGANHVIRKLNLHIRRRRVRRAARALRVAARPPPCARWPGLESIDSGEIRIRGRRVDHLPPQERDTAFVFQLYSLYPHLTSYDNIAFPLRAARHGPKRR